MSGNTSSAKSSDDTDLKTVIDLTSGTSAKELVASADVGSVSDGQSDQAPGSQAGSERHTSLLQTLASLSSVDGVAEIDRLVADAELTA